MSPAKQMLHARTKRPPLQSLKSNYLPSPLLLTGQMWHQKVGPVKKMVKCGINRGGEHQDSHKTTKNTLIFAGGYVCERVPRWWG